MGGVPLQSSRQGTESAEAEAFKSDCPLPASLEPAPSLQGPWGALMQGWGKDGRVSLHQHPMTVEGSQQGPAVLELTSGGWGSRANAGHRAMVGGAW